MARELLISCDRCRFEKDERSEAAPRTLGLDGKGWVLDLCDQCEDEVVGALRKLVADYGMPSEDVTPSPAAAPTRGEQPKKKRVGNNKERVPGQVVQTGSARGGRYLGPQQLDAGYPVQCLFCPDERKMWTASDVGVHLRTFHDFESTYDLWGHDCPICGIADFKRLANHMIMTHKRDMMDGVRLALEMGDPHGIAQRIMDKFDPATGKAKATITT